MTARTWSKSGLREAPSSTRAQSPRSWRRPGPDHALAAAPDRSGRTALPVECHPHQRRNPRPGCRGIVLRRRQHPLHRDDRRRWPWLLHDRRGSTDVFLLGTAGDTAAFGGDSTHLPAMGKSATDERDISGGTGSNGARASANGGQALSKATQSPASPASAAASDTPTTLEVVHPVSRSGTGGLFVLLGLLGLGLVVLAALGRRRFVRAGLRHGRSTQSSA